LWLTSLRTVGAARFVPELEPDAPIAAGDRIELAANLQRLHFFDLATGYAIRDDG
jgi:hypothetical protein